MNKYQAVCSVCFDIIIQGAEGKLLRHGFSTHNVKHGHNGGWHTGPCAGIRFPHFGESTEGTVWALGQAKTALALALARLQEHRQFPALQWSWTNTRKLAAKGQAYDSTVLEPDVTITLKPGDRRVFNYHYAVPSYGELHDAIQARMEALVEQITLQVTEYEQRIKTWRKAEPTLAPEKLATKHKANHRGRLLCSPRHNAYPGNSTIVAAEVTCQRCTRSMTSKS